MNSQRHHELVAFLRQLGIDPDAPGGPGQSDRSLELIDEALTHSSTGRRRNHDRLEFLGDAVLRLAASEFLRQHHPDLGVGECSSLRAQLVSDRWLSEQAARCSLDTVLQLGPMAMGDRAGRATVLAECCEALVGAVYLVWGGPRGGLEAVQRWLGPHWQHTTTELLADPLRHNWKSALQEWSQAQGQGLPDYQTQECSRVHGDPRRFRCRVTAASLVGEGWGGSRRGAEQAAAREALERPSVRPAQGRRAAR